MVIVTVLSVSAALVTIWMFLRNQGEKEQNRQYATGTFDSARKETEQLRQRLANYANEHEAWDEHFMQGFTFRQAINKLKESEREIFTRENREALKSSPGSGINFQNLVDRLEKHRLYLSQTERVFNRDFADE